MKSLCREPLLPHTDILKGGKYSWKSRHLLQVVLQLLQHGFQLWHFLFQVSRRVTATRAQPQLVRYHRCFQTESSKRLEWLLSAQEKRDFNTQSGTKHQTWRACARASTLTEANRAYLWAVWAVCTGSPLLWVFQLGVCLVPGLGRVSSFTVWFGEHERHCYQSESSRRRRLLRSGSSEERPPDTAGPAGLQLEESSTPFRDL